MKIPERVNDYWFAFTHIWGALYVDALYRRSQHALRRGDRPQAIRSLHGALACALSRCGNETAITTDSGSIVRIATALVNVGELAGDQRAVCAAGRAVARLFGIPFTAPPFWLPVKARKAAYNALVAYCEAAQADDEEEDLWLARSLLRLDDRWWGAERAAHAPWRVSNAPFVVASE